MSNNPIIKIPVRDIIPIIEQLHWLDEICKDSRGYLVGNPDPKPLEDFDSRVISTRTYIQYLRNCVAEQT